ncbi:hypothetical protein [Aquimarina sp. 2201CG5-10]|uniref:hypothetical protein n=1 Tax=Aquimarina callyspongiae TaxID=3098150 RepID=UPI002AB34496|nr:hypothetical protein [Aquimarina sp. 2201CG5-10]MDY8137736.1 hypothetical protein [Aquimarina sp. 2201CG5-10]
MSNATSTQNPVINQQGSAAIDSGQFATWNTANGSTSTLTISNSSRANTLSLGITGAPTTGIIVQVNGVSQPTLNNFYQIPPNTPSYTIQAQGDFAGTIVTITNNTNAQNDATAQIQAQTTKN